MARLSFFWKPKAQRALPTRLVRFLPAIMSGELRNLRFWSRLVTASRSVFFETHRKDFRRCPAPITAGALFIPRSLDTSEHATLAGLRR